MLDPARSFHSPSVKLFMAAFEAAYSDSRGGDTFAANESFGSVESVKAVSEVFTPIAGVVAQINESLADEPETVNSDPYGKGWMIRLKMSHAGEVDSLLTAAEYEDFTKAETE